MKIKKIFMKTKNIYILLFLVVAVLTSCDKKSAEDSGDPYFNFKDATETTSPTGFSVAPAGTTGQKYIIRSNKSWKIVAESENSWVKFFPDEGDDDGIVNVIVQENKTFEPREVRFTFVVDGEEQPVLFTVNQAQAVPYLTVADISSEKKLPQVASTFTVNVAANVDYTYTSDASWLTFVSKNVGAKSTDLLFSSEENTALASRTAHIVFTCAQFPNLNTTFNIKQDGKEGTVILFEDFNWLTYSNVVIPNTSSDAVRYDNWTADEKAKGWSSSINTASGSGSTPLLYACKGFVKLGKTNYGGDLISPKLSKLIATTNVTVKFKAVPYRTIFNATGGGGTKDGNIVRIVITGGGTASQTVFTLENWPNYPYGASTDELVAISNAMWADPVAERSFTITGATANTQITFIGDAYDLKTISPGKNRICLDDIKVLIPN